MALSVQYKIKSKVKEHHRKVRKEARKAHKLGLPIKSASKLTRIPNLFPGKTEMLEEQDLLKEIEKNRGKHSLITPQDIENLVTVESGENVIKAEEESVQKVQSKYDCKRELNLLVKSSDVIIEVLDARDPLSYRSKELEKKVHFDKDKRLVVVINKSDLVSADNADKWLKFIRRDIPTVLLSTVEGEVETKKSLDALFEIVTSITKDKEKVAVSLVGYPNTGKSAIVNLMKKRFLDVAKSKVLPCKEIQINKKTKLFDLCGTILSKNDTGPLMPKSSKSVEEVKTPLAVVDTIYNTIPHETLLELYEIASFDNVEEFLENVATSRNLKIRGGYADVERAARCVIEDVISGRIKFETPCE